MSGPKSIRTDYSGLPRRRRKGPTRLERSTPAKGRKPHHRSSFWQGDTAEVIADRYDSPSIRKWDHKLVKILYSVSNPGSKKSSAYYRVLDPETGTERTFKGHNLELVDATMPESSYWGTGVEEKNYGAKYNLERFGGGT